VTFFIYDSVAFILCVCIDLKFGYRSDFRDDIVSYVRAVVNVFYSITVLLLFYLLLNVPAKFPSTQLFGLLSCFVHGISVYLCLSMFEYFPRTI